MKSFKLKYGQEEVTFSLPEKQILHEIIGKNCSAVADIPAAVRAAMAKPIDSPPLAQIVKPGEKVVIAVSDVTRAWQNMPAVLPAVIDVISSAGVPDKDITIIVAVGGHRQNTEQEFEQLCGAEICRRIKVVNHDAWDTDNMVYLGKTSRGTEVSVNKLVAEADRVILTGGTVYHFMAGYGGGRKSVLPGISSIKTIRQNHLLAMSPAVGAGTNPSAVSAKMRGNECHEDMMDIAGFVQPDFIINVVPAPSGGFAGIFAGNWVSAWLESCKMVDELYGVEISGLADIVITTAGGYPKDINLYQTTKTMDNAGYAVKKGGVVILLSECSDIMEPEEFTQWFNYDSKQSMEKALREAFTIPGFVALKAIEYSDKATYIQLTRAENADFVRKANMIPATTIEEALRIAKEKCALDNPTFTVMPQGANTLPVLRQ